MQFFVDIGIHHFDHGCNARVARSNDHAARVAVVLLSVQREAFRLELSFAPLFSNSSLLALLCHFLLHVRLVRLER